MKKLLVRLGLGAAMLAGTIGFVSNAEPAKALPLGIAGGLSSLCHDTVVLGTVVCVLQGDEGHVNYLLEVADHHGVTVSNDGDQVYFSLFGGAIQALGLSVNNWDNRVALTEFSLNDWFGSRGAQFVVFNDSDDPDGGHIRVYDSHGSGRFLEIDFSNGDCDVFYNGHWVAPCALRVVPVLPFIPNLPALP